MQTIASTRQFLVIISSITSMGLSRTMIVFLNSIIHYVTIRSLKFVFIDNDTYIKLAFQGIFSFFSSNPNFPLNHLD